MNAVDDLRRPEAVHSVYHPQSPRKLTNINVAAIINKIPNHELTHSPLFHTCHLPYMTEILSTSVYAAEFTEALYGLGSVVE